jgi:ADP-ribosyl-[dinitrogen reductase] hydrolase
MRNEEELISRYRGALLGLAVGDALGAPFEGMLPGTFECTGMAGGGPHGVEPGQWTDDTSLALCLAESLIARRAFDPADQLERYLRWMRSGHLSSKGRCFGIGGTTRRALELFERAGEPYCGPTEPRTAGNGSIMRLAPVPLAFAADSRRAGELSADSSRTTHGAREAVDACRYFGRLLVGAVKGASKEELLSERYGLEEEPLSPGVERVAAGSFRRRAREELVADGYVVRSLEAALWAFHNTSSFREGALLAVNLGYDTDTTGAVYGQLAGAFYGVEEIPERWREKVDLWLEGSRGEGFEDFADGLFGLSRSV